MGKCKLYMRSSGYDFYIGRFRSREVAENHWKNYKDYYSTQNPNMKNPKPIYVEQGKGKVK